MLPNHDIVKSGFPNYTLIMVDNDNIEEQSLPDQALST